MVGTHIKVEFYHTLNILEKANKEQILAVSHGTRPKRYPLKLPREDIKKKKSKEVFLQIVHNYVVEFFLEDIVVLERSNRFKEEQNSALKQRQTQPSAQKFP